MRTGQLLSIQTLGRFAAAIDGFKALLVRFEFSVRNWSALHFIAFSVIFLRKINKKIKV